MNRFSGPIKVKSMSKVTKTLVMSILICISFSYGFLSGFYKIFPYDQIKVIKDTFMGPKGACEYCGANPKWPERLEQFRTFPSKATNVMVGDSITHVAHWKEIFPDYSIVNRGIGFDKTTDVLNRLDTVFSADPERVFLMMGVNDFNLANRDVRDVFATYKEVIERIKIKEIDVVISSTLECANCGDTTDKIRKLNKMLESYAEENQIIFIDINSYLSDENGLQSSFQQDGVHPNAEGYKVWSTLLKPYLLSEGQ